MKNGTKIGLIMMACSIILSVWVLAGHSIKATDPDTGNVTDGDMAFTPGQDIPADDGGSTPGTTNPEEATTRDGDLIYTTVTGRLVGVSPNVEEIVLTDAIKSIADGVFADTSVTTVRGKAGQGNDSIATAIASQSNKNGVQVTFVTGSGGTGGDDGGGGSSGGDDGGNSGGDNGGSSGGDSGNTGGGSSGGSSGDSSGGSSSSDSGSSAGTTDTQTAAQTTGGAQGGAAAKAKAVTSTNGGASKTNANLDSYNTSEGGYTFLDGVNGTVPQSTTNAYRVRVSGDLALFSYVDIDGATVDTSNYVLSEGSTIIEFTPTFIHTLSTGTHKVTAHYSDGGYASTAMIVTGDNAKDATPKTADPLDTRFILALSLLVLGLGMFLWSRFNAARLETIRRR